VSSSTQHSWLDLGGGHQCARKLAILSGQIDLADGLVELDQLEVVGGCTILALSVSRIIKFVSAHMRASRRSGDGSPLQRLLGHELVVEFRKWREMSGKGKASSLGRATHSYREPTERRIPRCAGGVGARRLDEHLLGCLQGLTVELRL
jgi:hypothetical protein